MNFKDLTLEQPISRYKTFFKKYLTTVENRELVIEELYGLCKQFNKIEPRTTSDSVKNWINLEIQIKKFLTAHFNPEILRLYNKVLPERDQKINNLNSEYPLWLQFLSNVSQSLNDLNESFKQEINYKRNFLNFLYDCLIEYGLHPNIFNRDPAIDKKFNLLINHDYRSETILTDFRIMMSLDVFEAEFIKPYLKRNPIKVRGKLIPFINISELKITTTLLKEDEISLFALKNNFIWSDDEKDQISFINLCIDETDAYHPNPFVEPKNYNGVDSLSVEQVKNLLKNYSGSYKLYVSAINKYEKREFPRNVLDDLRLSLEILLKELFNNKKSLENQLSEIGNYQKSRGATNEITNLFQKLIEYYSKYQNNNVKHNDNVKENEIAFIIELTNTFLKYLLKN